MSTFTEKCTFNGISLQVTFRRIALTLGSKYFVVASRGRDELPALEIKYDYNQWKAVPPVPFWAEDGISTLIRSIQRIEIDLLEKS